MCLITCVRILWGHFDSVHLSSHFFIRSYFVGMGPIFTQKAPPPPPDPDYIGCSNYGGPVVHIVMPRQLACRGLCRSRATSTPVLCQMTTNRFLVESWLYRKVRSLLGRTFSSPPPHPYPPTHQIHVHCATMLTEKKPPTMHGSHFLQSQGSEKYLAIIGENSHTVDVITLL